MDILSSAPDNAVKTLTAMKGIGEITAKTMLSWYDRNQLVYTTLRNELNIQDDVIEAPSASTNNDLEGKTFVITGALTHFENRAQLKLEIESRGGKVSGSVSKKTSYLITNFPDSNTGKAKDAKALHSSLCQLIRYNITISFK
jgi:DNA ligase (NAD+)